MARHSNVSPLLVLGALCASCTPMAYSDINWVVVNTTEDTLVVAARYPLDSTQLSVAEVAHVRHEWLGKDSVTDSFDSPLQYLTQHGPTWYIVGTRELGMPWTMDNGSAIRTNRRRGLLIYAVPPHATQTLFSERRDRAISFNPPTQAPMLGLLLQQGQHRHWVLPGQPVAEVFHVNPRKEDWFGDSSHEIQVVVGPALTINRGFRLWWYNWWTPTRGK